MLGFLINSIPLLSQILGYWGWWSSRENWR